MIFRFVKEKKKDVSIKSSAISTFKQIQKPSQILIIPITIWTGLEAAFIPSDVTVVSVTLCIFL